MLPCFLLFKWLTLALTLKSLSILLLTYRAEVRFQRFGDQVGLDVSKPSVTEDSSLNIGSDGEANRDNNINSKNVELPNHASTSKKRSRLHPPYGDEAKLGNLPE